VIVVSLNCACSRSTFASGVGFPHLQLRLELDFVYTSDDLPGRHHVALLRHNLDNAAGDLRRDVDLRGFKAAVDAHDALG
jgi:hypothetical protein